MAKPIRSLWLFVVFSFLTGCAYVGAPLPPALNIPAAVNDLTVVEQGDKLIVRFTIPALTTEGMARRSFGPVDLRVGPMTALPFDVNEWAEQARPIGSVPAQPGPVHIVVAASQWVNQEVVAAVRLANVKGRLSDWSNIITMRLVPPLAAPADLRTEGVREGVRLTWRALPQPGVSYRVYRRTEKEEPETLVATVSAGEWVDTSTKYGVPYRYSVQAFEKHEDIDAESEMSAPVGITPVAKFPPAVPTGLRAVAGTESIELEWERNTEPELKGYRVYRAVNGGEWERIAEVDVPSYSDRAIKPGRRYRYAVSAIDQAGNESARSAPVEVMSP
jgi:hypothetical protein